MPVDGESGSGLCVQCKGSKVQYKGSGLVPVDGGGIMALCAVQGLKGAVQVLRTGSEGKGAAGGRAQDGGLQNGGGKRCMTVPNVLALRAELVVKGWTRLVLHITATKHIVVQGKCGFESDSPQWTQCLGRMDYGSACLSYGSA
eukprot:365052-Chlamydomonas_euryale.AAC.16